MKKTLALVLAFALVFSTMTMAFADDAAAIGADAKVCSDLGMLKGATGTVDAAYLATVPNRLQAAVMFLRLKGLEADANAFTGTENFADANKVNWGKPVMAYLKAHPELGWVGDGTNFSPDSAMTAQQYYKVMLEALGYKQNTATVVGDFTWENVMTFAASKGLTKNAAVTNFTVNDLAVATVEALKGTVKDSTKTLAATLVEAGKLDKAKAIAAGVYTDEATTTAVLDEVKAVSNTKVLVTFSADVAKAYAENAANYKVVVKGSSTALEIKSATQESSTKVVLETAAQTGGTAYTATVGAVSLNFAGLAADKSAAKVDSVSCTDTNTVEVKFDKMMDKASAETIANYTLNNSATVKAAVLASNRKKVTLTTEGVAKNKAYTVKIQNVKSADLVAIATVSKNFTGKADTTAPKIDNIDTDSNNIRVIVNFEDDHGVDVASAENVANYKITTTGTDTLEVKAAKAIDNDDDDYYYTVELTTAPQENGAKYTLHINNLVDGSVSANKITKELTKEFRGKKADSTSPKVKTLSTSTDNKFKVVFDESSRMDVASATDINNYSFDNDVVVKSAEILDTEDMDSTDAHTVVLTTSAVDEGDWYKLTVKNVADEFGNVIKTVTKNIKGVKEDVTPPYVSKVKSVSPTSVELYFANERLEKASAEDPTNYVFNNDLGAALKAELSDDHTYVTLTTPEQDFNTAYKVTINNVKDENGNALSNVVVRVVTTPDEIDNTRPEVSSIDASYANVVRITFSEEVETDGTNPTMTLWNGTTNVAATMVGNLLDDGYTAEFKTASDLDPTKEYRIDAINHIRDIHRNIYVVPSDVDDRDTFDGTDLPNPGPEVDSWEQLDAQTMRVYFNEPVVLNAAYDVNQDGTLVVADGDTLWSTHATVADSVTKRATGVVVTVDPEGDGDDAGYSTVDFVKTSGWEADETYGFDFSDIVKDYAGKPAVDADDEVDDSEVITSNTYTEMEAYIDDEDGPEITGVEAVNNKEIEVTYNENIDATHMGSYKITYEDDDVTKSVTIAAGGISVDDNVVTIDTTTVLKSDFVYTLKQGTAAEDMSGNKAVIEKDGFDFDGTDVVVADYIKGVKIIDSDTIEVLASNDMDNATHIIVQRLNTSGTAVETVKDYTLGAASDDEEITLDKPMVADVDYKVTATIGGHAYTYTFTGIEADGNVSVDEADDVVSFSDMDVENFVVEVVYDFDGNGTSEIYLVKPSTTDPDTAEFDATTLYLKGTPGTTKTLASIPQDSTYVVKVYRTKAALTAAQFDTAVHYDTNVTTVGLDSAPAYTAEITQP